MNFIKNLFIFCLLLGPCFLLLECGESVPAEEDIVRDIKKEILEIVLPSGFGDKCTSNEGCGKDLLCSKNNGKEGFCTYGCGVEKTCPDGWYCGEIIKTGGEMEKMVCFPVQSIVCKPCENDVDCLPAGGFCKGFDVNGKFCTISCNEEKKCPDNFSCIEDVCLPLTKECDDCPKEFYGSNTKTQCFKGKCKGYRYCGDEGLTPCDAKDPSTDICDGEDNDCDEEIDEDWKISCDDKLSCTEDFCNDGKCINKIGKDDCIIDGKCYKHGEKNEDNSCKECNVGVSQKEWTNNSAPCDDNNLCTKEDKCKGGECVGIEYECGKYCAKCDGKGKCIPKEGYCIINEECVEEGEKKIDNLCLECIPSISNTDFSPNTSPCDDGQICTKDDSCFEGKCAGIDYKNECVDKFPCTSNGCDGKGGCVFDVYPEYCLIDEKCIEAGVLKDNNPCQACNPLLNPYKWTETNVPCDDANPCTKDDKCSAEICQGINYDCNDNIACTEDTCDGKGGCENIIDPSFCLIDGNCYKAEEKNPLNQCEWCSPAENPKGWSLYGGGCEDENKCTINDKCVSGECMKGDILECNDNNICTDDKCDEKTGCEFLPNDNPCDDFNPCTKGDKCEGGECKSGSINTCACDENKPCPEPANKCIGKYFCNMDVTPHQCEIIPDSEVKCNPVNDTLCLKNICDGETGECKMTPVNENDVCNDGESCTMKDKCKNGICKGEVYSCNDEKNCTDDICNGDGGCSFPIKEGFCLIGNKCYSSGWENPLNSCQVCDPKTSKIAWSSGNEGGACNDGKDCTHSDKCINGACSAIPYSCNDGKECTNDICKGDGGCINEIIDNWCFIGGICYASGIDNPKNQCQVCNPLLLKTGWSLKEDGTKCYDGNDCTIGDKCVEGYCEGGKNICGCQEDKDCPDDNDLCNGIPYCDKSEFPFKCKIDPSTIIKCDSSNDTFCLKNTCEPSSGKCSMKPSNEGLSCNDNKPCTKEDKCKNGQCAGLEYSCNDGKECTKDECKGDGNCLFPIITGKCLIDGFCYNDGDSNPNNQCQRCNTSVSNTIWINKPDGTLCNDNLPCTKEDKCSDGICKGTSYTCDDNKECTEDICKGDGGCDYPLKTLYCYIGGVCYLNGEDNPLNKCQKCDAGKSQTAWTNKEDGVGCDDDNKCTGNDKCKNGVCMSESLLYCSDNSPCTDDICDPKIGCVFPCNTYQEECYSGDPKTKGIGECKAGVRKCNNCNFGSCEGEITPVKEICGDNKDNDCDGKTDEVDEEDTTYCELYYHDVDGDTWGDKNLLPKCFCSPGGGSDEKWTAKRDDDCDDQDKNTNPDVAYDPPDPLLKDQNCDGIDGTINAAVFVSYIYGSDANLGTPSAPKKTINAGIKQAKNDNKSDVYIHDAIYEEGVISVQSGISLYGGYKATKDLSEKIIWTGRAYDFQTIVRNSKIDTALKNTVITFKADNITNHTMIDALKIEAKNNNPQPQSEPAVSTYGIYVLNGTNKNFVVRKCFIESGPGGDGKDGINGSAGDDGSEGGKGEDGKVGDDAEGGYGANGGCNNGGDGGKGIKDSNGEDGESGKIPGKGGGAGGKGGKQTSCNFSNVDGGNGGNGESGINGNNGFAQTNSSGKIKDNLWFPYDGNDGNDGTAGHGGGGGGGGASCTYTGLKFLVSGGGGGGGGSGGCGGKRGTGGKGGGGSFGIFVINATLSVQGTIIKTIGGGKGGRGGDGGEKGKGGSGGQGGSGYYISPIDPPVKKSGNGGNGGQGGDGGYGGGASGAPGGISYGIYGYNLSLIPDITETEYDIGFGGDGGEGGVGDPAFPPAQNGPKGEKGNTNF